MTQMNIENIVNILTEEVCKVLNEGWYDTSATPLFTKNKMYNELGNNPLMVDNGNRTPSDMLRQVSTVDFNGANFKGETIVLSDNKFTIYKIKNFGNDKIKSTLSLFGSGANGEKELRRAIDILNGAANRNGKRLSYRIISSELNKGHTSVNNSFYEYSLDNGNEWYILRPNPIDNMTKSKLIRK